MVAPHEAGPVEDSIAREMARLTFEKVTTIAGVQYVHSRRLASIESKLDDHSVTLNEHGIMLRQILARLPEPPAA